MSPSTSNRTSLVGPADAPKRADERRVHLVFVPSLNWFCEIDTD